MELSFKGLMIYNIIMANKEFTTEGIFFFDEEGDPIYHLDWSVPYLFQESESESEIQKGVLEREDNKITEEMLSYCGRPSRKTVFVEVVEDEGGVLFEDGSSYAFYQPFTSRAAPNLVKKIEPKEDNAAIS